MNANALDLLLRVVTERLGNQACSRCGERLSGEHAAVRGVRNDDVAVEIRCAACGHANVLQVRPDGGR